MADDAAAPDGELTASAATEDESSAIEPESKAVDERSREEHVVDERRAKSMRSMTSTTARTSRTI